jgi:hypothetical protein
MATGKPSTHFKKTRLKSLGLATLKRMAAKLSHSAFLAMEIKNLAWA